MAAPRWLRWLADKIVDNAFVYGGGAVIAAVGAIAAIYQSLRDELGPIAPYVAVYLVLFLVAVALLIVNQLHFIHERGQRRRRANLTPVEIERLIRDWLYSFKFEIKDDPQDYAAFQIRATDSESRHVTVFQRKGEPYVTITTRLILPDDMVPVLVGDPKSTFLPELSLHLAPLGVEYRKEPSSNDVYVAHVVVFDESMTPLKFINDIGLVRRGLTIVHSLIARRKALLP
jgi:uncharacterized protein DUF2299